MTQAVLYLRQSQDLTGLQAAIGRQREDCLALAASRGWRVAEEFQDNDVSALARKRPGYERMLARIRAGGIDVILVWHVDRLVRRLADLEPVLALCERSGTVIATVTGDLDLGTDAGRLVARILGSVAQAEIERKSVRQRRAHRQRAEAGVVKLLRRPFGYTLAGKIDRREAHTLRYAVAAVLDDRSLPAVVRDLNARGRLTSTGAQWKVTSLIRVLRNPRYAGIATYHGHEVGTGTWTPIIDIATHHSLIAKLDDPVRLSRFALAGRKHLMSGLLRCGACGERMGSTGISLAAGGGVSYRCPRYHVYRRELSVDRVVVSALLTRLAQPGALELAEAADPGRATEARRDLLACRARLSQAAVAFADGDIDRAQLAAASSRLHRDERRLESQWAAAARPAALAVLLGATAHARPARHLARAWDGMTLEAKRTVIEATLVAIVHPVGPGRHFSDAEVTIQWRKPKPSHSTTGAHHSACDNPTIS